MAYNKSDELLQLRSSTSYFAGEEGLMKSFSSIMLY